jgi:hypothetical protein
MPEHRHLRDSEAVVMVNSYLFARIQVRPAQTSRVKQSGPSADLPEPPVRARPKRYTEDLNRHIPYTGEGSKATGRGQSVIESGTRSPSALTLIFSVNRDI